jgi:hypothetical protein
MGTEKETVPPASSVTVVEDVFVNAASARVVTFAPRALVVVEAPRLAVVVFGPRVVVRVLVSDVVTVVPPPLLAVLLSETGSHWFAINYTVYFW